MATAVPTSSTITSLSDPRIKDKLQELRQTDNETAILTKTIIPSVGLRFLVSGFIGYVPYLLFGGYGNARRIETEAIEFVRTAEQFK